MSLYNRTITLLAVTLLSAGCASATRSGEAPRKLSSTEKARLFIQAASGALEENDPIGALQLLEQARELDADLPEIYHVRAIAFYAKHEPEEAIIAARKAVELAPEFSEANNTLGKFLIDQGNLKEAEAPLKKAAADQLNRGAYKANTNLGILYYRQGKYEASSKHLKKAAEQNPLAACVAWYYLGHLELREGHFNDAIKDYDRATQKLCANFPDAHMALGIAYERSHQYDRARKKFVDIKSTFPNSKVAEQAMDRLRYLP